MNGPSVATGVVKNVCDEQGIVIFLRNTPSAIRLSSLDRGHSLWTQPLQANIRSELSVGWVDPRVGLGSEIYVVSGLGWVMGLKLRFFEK